MLNLAIRNARLVTPKGIVEGSLGIDGERIAYVGTETGLPAAEHIIDGQGNFLIPGFIDAHVHVGARGTGPLEAVLGSALELRTRTALFGGVTTAGIFIRPDPPEAVASLAATYRGVGERHAYIDFYLHAIITSAHDIAEIPTIAEKHGITSFKHFYNANKPRSKEDHPVYPGIESDLLLQSLERIVSLGPLALPTVHCEDQDIIWVLEDRLKAQGRNDLAAQAEARPGWVEALRMRMAYDIAKAVKAPLYCVHIAAAEGVEIMAEARREGYPYWGETMPHYLSHTADMETEIGCWGKTDTAIKWEKDRRRLWEGLRDGSITNMGTEGIGQVRAIKEGGGGKHDNNWGSANGVSGGLRHWLPVMMSLGVSTGQISIEDMVRVCCTNNAQVFGLYPRKGALLEGSDADLVLVDPNAETVVTPAFYHGSTDWSIYEGWKLRGDARVTILRGKVAMEDGEIKASPGWGRYLARAPA